MTTALPILTYQFKIIKRFLQVWNEKNSFLGFLLKKAKKRLLK